MFNLRRITSESVQINTCLGTDYVLILKETCKDEFERTSKLMKWDEADMTKDIYGYITFNDGGSVMPLYEKSHYYIMASDGKTMDNISYK